VASCGHQVVVGSEIESQSSESTTDQHMVQLSRGPATEGAEQGSCHMAQGIKITLNYNRLTDVMFVDLLPLEEGSRVDVLDIGDEIGFPGQVQVRVDRKRQIFYGLTIQNYTGFRRKILWQYRMWSIQCAIKLLVSTLLAGLDIDHRATPQRPAMSY